MGTKMKLGFIGYKNHAGKILDLALADSIVNNVTVYHPNPNKLVAAKIQEKSNKISLTSDFEKLLQKDAVFIASPNETHVPYLKKLLPTNACLFCEKIPAASLEEWDFLCTLPEDQKKRIYFNFNHRHSAFVKEARYYLQTGSLGAPVRLAFASAHGMGYRKSYIEKWQHSGVSPIDGILPNWAIHFLDNAHLLFGPPDEVTIRQKSFADPKSPFDALTANLAYKNGFTADIFYSYATPFFHHVYLLFTNGYLELKNGTLSVHSPRDYFDELERFTPPEGKVLFHAASTKDYYDHSLKISVETFLQAVRNRTPFPLSDFALSMQSTQLALGKH